MPALTNAPPNSIVAPQCSTALPHKQTGTRQKPRSGTGRADCTLATAPEFSSNLGHRRSQHHPYPRFSQKGQVINLDLAAAATYP